MSLRLNLVLSILSMLLISLALGAALSWRHAMRSVHAEMEAALAVGSHTVETAVGLLVSNKDQKAGLEQIVAAFDGDRHLRASLIGENGATLATSSLSTPVDRVPDWFAHALSRDEPKMKIGLPANLSGGDWLLLETDPQNELTEVWTEFSDNLRTFVAFAIISLPLVYWTVGRALRPLAQLSRAFRNVGSGASTANVDERGPPELADLARGFNAMIERLALVEAQNQRLNEQVLTIQEEERAEIARDMHDEIGPYLFAMGVDAAAVQRALDARNYDQIPGPLRAIREGVAHIQHQVKSILGRLRSGGLTQFGLSQALANLAAFWRSRHAEVEIAIVVAEAKNGFGEALDAAIYRIVQESINNAIRHGKPHRVDVRIDATSKHEITVEVCDDGGGLERSAETRGFGLRGMAERVTALGGDLSIRDRLGARGVVVTARFPSTMAMRGVPA